VENKINYNKIYDGILEIKNFLSNDECKNIVKIIESLSEDCWQEDQYKNWDKRNLKYDIKNKDLDAVKNKILIKVKNIFESYLMIVPPENNYVSIQRILPETGGLINEVFEKTRYMSTFFIHENENVPALLREVIYE